MSVLKFRTHALTMVLSYVMGIFALSVVVLLSFGGLYIFVLAGGVIAAPLMIIPLALAWFCRDSLEKHLIIWCVAAPFLAFGFWIVAEYFTNFIDRLTVTQYVHNRGVWERSALAFFCTAACAVVYGILLRFQLKRKAAQSA